MAPGRRAPPLIRCLVTFSLILMLLVPTVPAYPTLDDYVTDEVGVLTASEMADIAYVCMEVYQNTSAEFAVLIVNTTQPDGINLFAVKTFEENGLGQEDEDNGLLLIISVSESEWRIEVGYGLEGVLPDSLVGNIADDHLVPFLAEGDYYNGILYCMAFLGEQVLDNYDGPPPGDDRPIDWLPCRTWQILVVAVVLLVILLSRGRVILWFLPFLGRGGGGKDWGGGRSGGGGARGKWR